MKGVIIAGGKAEELRPVTHEIPQALIPVNGRNAADHIIDLFWNNQIYETWLSLGHYADKVRKEYDSLPFWMDRHTERWNIIPLGTGGWLVRLANSPTREMFQEDFVVVNVDNLMDFDLAAMIEQHKNSDDFVTIACTKVDDVSKYGSVAIKDKKITNFEEKARSNQKKSGWVNAGFYVFDGEAIIDRLKDIDHDLNDAFSLEKDLFPELAKEGKIGGYKTDEEWYDLNTFDGWSKAIKEWNGIGANGK